MPERKITISKTVGKESFEDGWAVELVYMDTDPHRDGTWFFYPKGIIVRDEDLFDVPYTDDTGRTGTINYFSKVGNNSFFVQNTFLKLGEYTFRYFLPDCK
jgi:hypothetical protein